MLDNLLIAFPVAAEGEAGPVRVCMSITDDLPSISTLCKSFEEDTQTEMRPEVTRRAQWVLRATDTDHGCKGGRENYSPF